MILPPRQTGHGTRTLLFHRTDAGINRRRRRRSPARILFTESFGDKLDKDWAWVREEPKSWHLENNSLVLRTQPGYIHGRSNDAKNILVRPVPEAGGAAVAIEVVVENDPKIQFEHAGLLWYFDDDNYVGIYKESLGGKPEIQMIAEKDAKPTGAVKTCDASKVWLRLVVSGGKVTGQFRESEKDEWKTVGEKPAPMTGPAKAGIIAGRRAERRGSCRDVQGFSDRAVVKVEWRGIEGVALRKTIFVTNSS